MLFMPGQVLNFVKNTKPATSICYFSNTNNLISIKQDKVGNLESPAWLPTDCLLVQFQAQTVDKQQSITLSILVAMSKNKLVIILAYIILK
jgi:hypothetical protein